MGNVWNSAWISDIPTSGFNLRFKPEVTPHPLKDVPDECVEWCYSTDRKPREMIALEEELRSAKVPLKHRDYCSHLLLKFRGCRRQNWPFVVFCSHEKHEYLTCQYDDFVVRMKEYERERRCMVITKNKFDEKIHKGKNKKEDPTKKMTEEEKKKNEEAKKKEDSQKKEG